MKILIVEDEILLSDNIVSFLTSDNYICEQAFTYQEAQEKINLYQYDCILIDLNLPGGDGLNLLGLIKEKNLPCGIIIISARGSLDNRVEGLRLGADDYLAKPFSLPELSARIYALMRRRNFANSNYLQSRNLKVDLLSKQVFVDGAEIVLTKTEYDLLLFLITNKARVISKSSIAEHLSGDMADMLDNHNFVYSHVKNLKAKLAAVGFMDCIKTVYGVGYQWEE